MIKANELRKGNLFLYKGNVTEVVGIDQNDNIIIDNDYYDEGIEHVKEDDGGPVPLTPEWLERCGFKNEDGSTLWDNGIIAIFDYNENNVYSFHYQSKKATIECLHQLQNLYFSLTGEELNVKL